MEEIRKTTITKYKKLYSGISTESSLYLVYDRLYKILNSNIIENREEIINRFINNNINGCSKIYDALYDNNKFYGYSMQYYEDYSILDKKMGKLNYEQKKQICQELIRIYTEIKDKLGILYYDFHEFNVLIKNEKIVLIDLDSCLENNRNNIILCEGYLSEFILTILFDINPSFINLLGEKGKVGIYTKLFEDLDFTYGSITNINELSEYIATISKKEIKQKKLELPKNAII